MYSVFSSLSSLSSLSCLLRSSYRAASIWLAVLLCLVLLGLSDRLKKVAFKNFISILTASILWLMLWCSQTLLVQAQLADRYIGGRFIATVPSITSSLITHARGSTFDDQEYTNVAIGFPFYFNGTYYTSLTISANGWVSFGSGVPRVEGSKFTYGLNANGGSGVIAALSQDWAGWDSASISSGNATFSNGVRQFIVQWNRLRFSNAAAIFNVEMSVSLVLIETGDIYIYLRDIQFLSPTPNAFLTQIGLRGATSNDVFCFTNNNGSWSNIILSGASMPFASVGQGQGPTGADNPSGQVRGFQLRSQPPPFVAPPTITGFSPTSGMTGTTVIITGTNFTGTTAVRFGTVNASFTVNSPTQITATVPSGATTAPVTVVTPNGMATSAAAFTVALPPTPTPPTITGFSPTSGMTGTTVIITGTNFTGTTAVRFGTVNASFTVNSPTQITATVPSGATTAPVTVVTPNGMATSAAAFTVTAPSALPTVSRISASEGATGSRVTITGTGFRSPMTVTLAARRAGGTILGVVCSSVNVLSPTTLEAIVGFNALSATGEVVVQTPDGISPPAPSVQFDYLAAPIILSATPSTGSTGDIIEIRGRNFLHPRTSLVFIRAVRFGGRPAANTTVFSTGEPDIGLIRATVGDGATGRIEVENGLGSVSTEDVRFVFGTTPVITSFSPTSGPVGTTVTINGTNLSATTAVYFGGVPATTVRVVSATQVQATVPSGAVTGVVAVSTSMRATARSSGTFTVESMLAAPMLTPAAINITAPNTLDEVITTFRWNAVAGAASYFFELAYDAAFTRIGFDLNTGSSTSFRLRTPNPGRTPSSFFWRVRSLNASQTSPWANGTLTITPAPQLLPLIPLAQAQGGTVTIRIQGIATDFTRVTSVVLRRDATVISGAIGAMRTATEMSATFTIPSTAPVGDYTLTVNDPAGNLSQTFTVNAGVGGIESPVSNGFNPRIHGFAFCNCYGQIWPPIRPIDYTDARFPELIRDSARTGAITSDDWGTFEDGVARYSILHNDPQVQPNDGLNYTGSLRDIPLSFVRPWVLAVSDPHRGWHGSCYGMSVVALFNYAGYPAYQFSQPPFMVTGTTLRNESLQKLINRHCYPQLARSFSPNEAVSLLRRAFSSGDRTQQRLLYVYDGAHVVVPYRLVSAQNASGVIIDSIYVYDPNSPGNLNLVVSVNRSMNTMSYDRWTSSPGGTVAVGIPLSEHPKFTRPFSDILVTNKDEHSVIANTDSTTLRLELTFPWFASANGYITPQVTLRNQWGQHVSTNGPIPSPTWSTVEPIRETGGLPPNFFSIVRGFAIPVNSASTTLTAEYQPVEIAQIPVASQTQSISITDPNLAMYAMWRTTSANGSRYRIVSDIKTSKLTFVAPTPSSGVDISITRPLPDSKTPQMPSVRVWNTSSTTNDSLSIELDNQQRRVIVNSFASQRSYNIDFEFGSQRRKFAAIPIAAEETHIYSLDDWTQLATTNLTLTSRTLTDIGAVVERPVNLRPFTATSVRHTQSVLLSDAVKAYPNPTQGTFTLEYNLTAPSEVLLEVINVLGSVVWKQSLGRIEAGKHNHVVEPSLPAGSYRCRLRAGEHTQTTMLHVVR
jgi:hypothetical protein